MAMPSDLEIARQARLKPIAEIAEQMGIEPRLLEHYGESVAKIKLDAIAELADRPKAKYVVVSAVTPTPLGEGKTTTTVGPWPGDASHRQARDDRDPPALDGADLRHQGRRGRRRVQPGRPDGSLQPPSDRRHARGDGGAQHAVGDGRQPPPQGQ